MNVTKFLDQDVTIRRLKSVSGYKKAIRATATADAHIRELDAGERTAMGIIQERAWICWLREDTDIKEQDVLYDEDDNRFQVREITIKEYGLNRCKEVILIEYSG